MAFLLSTGGWIVLFQVPAPVLDIRQLLLQRLPEHRAMMQVPEMAELVQDHIVKQISGQQRTAPVDADGALRAAAAPAADHVPDPDDTGYR